MGSPEVTEECYVCGRVGVGAVMGSHEPGKWSEAHTPPSPSPWNCWIHRLGVTVVQFSLLLLSVSLAGRWGRALSHHGGEGPRDARGKGTES